MVASSETWLRIFCSYAVGPTMQKRQILGRLLPDTSFLFERPLRVISVALIMGLSLLVCPQLRTFSAPVGLSQRCQQKRSLVFAPWAAPRKHADQKVLICEDPAANKPGR
jgi:hypothetical protein